VGEGLVRIPESRTVHEFGDLLGSQVRALLKSLRHPADCEPKIDPVE
jgi:hypothetical protein